MALFSDGHLHAAKGQGNSRRVPLMGHGDGRITVGKSVALLRSTGSTVSIPSGLQYISPMQPFHSIYSHGFTRVAVCIPSLRVADPRFNEAQTLALAARASELKAAVA